MLTRTGICFLVILFLTSCGAELLCQELPQQAYRLKYFGTKEGLSSRIAYSSLRDSTGVVWSGTTGGLCRIHEDRITVFKEFTQTFHGPMTRDGKGWLYVENLENSDSVEVINPATLEVWGVRFNDRSRGIFGGMVQRTGEPLYFVQGSIVYKYVPGEELQQVHLLANEIEAGDQLLFASEKEYMLYRTSTETVEEQVDDEFDRFELPTDAPPDFIHLDKRGFLWTSNSLGTFRKPPRGDFERFLPPLGQGKIINFFAEDEQGNMFFGYLDPVLLRITYLEQVINGIQSSAQWITKIDDRIITISGNDFSQSLRMNTYGGIYALDFEPAPESPFRRFLYRDVLDRS